MTTYRRAALVLTAALVCASLTAGEEGTEIV
jgi:hypothetical protein